MPMDPKLLYIIALLYQTLYNPLFFQNMPLLTLSQLNA